MVLEKKLILLFLLFLVTAAILDSWLDPILQFWNPAAWSCSMWNLKPMGAVVLEKKLFEVVWICRFLTSALEQNYTRKQKVGHCDKTPQKIFFIFIILNTKVSLMFHAKIQTNIPSGSGEEVYFVVFAIFSNGGHLGFSTWPNFFNSETLESGHAPCEIWEPWDQ